MKLSPSLVIFVSFVVSVVANLWQGSELSNSRRTTELLKMQLNLSDQHVGDLEYTNSQLLNGQLDGYGNARINIDTIKYAAFCEGYNNAVRDMGKKYPDSGYATGYHAAISDIESKNTIESKNVKVPKETKE